MTTELTLTVSNKIISGKSPTIWKLNNSPLKKVVKQTNKTKPEGNQTNFELNKNDNMTLHFEMQIKQCLEGNVNNFGKIKHPSHLKTFSKFIL